MARLVENKWTDKALAIYHPNEAIWKQESRLARQAKRDLSGIVLIPNIWMQEGGKKKCDDQHQNGANFSKRLH